MGPVAIHEDQDVPPRRHAGATLPSRVMPARPRIAAFVALLLALASPAPALAQSGGGGAGDSQYQDPFGTSTQAKPAKPAAPKPQPTQTQAPAAQSQAPTAQTQAPAAQAQAAPTQAASAQTLPRTGFDVLPVAAVGLVLLLGGLALWRRPHADR
jgi:LPXTG-motif cell wall-anchored protein